MVIFLAMKSVLFIKFFFFTDTQYLLFQIKLAINIIPFPSGLEKENAFDSKPVLSQGYY
jgi:hypothetical protein|uniref:Uncharacterized protein n=1 Tax=Populus trichocarpa TaxID=3694 RepID=A0A3N7FLR7_POPTR